MKLWKSLAWSLFLVASASLVGCAKNPVTGKTELSLLSESEEISLGVQSRPEVLQEYDGMYRDRGLQRYVTEVGMGLAAVSHRPNLPYSFEALNSSEINAFALPGGKIFITRGLVSRLHNEAQLAGVLGHEIGHVTAKHAVRSLSSAILLQIPLIIGATYAESKGKGEILVAIGLISSQLLQLKFSRNHESESDRLGILYSSRAGYNPEGMVELLEVLHEEEGGASGGKLLAMLSTHPLTEKRIDEAKAIVARDFPNLDSMNLAWNPERFEEKVLNLRQEQPAFDDFDVAEAARKEGRYSDALKLYNSAISQVPQEPIFYVRRGLTYRSMAKGDKAREDLHQAAFLADDLFAAQFGLGLVEMENKNPDAAMEALSKSAELYPSSAEPYFYMGQISEEKGEEAEAKKYYKLVSELAQADSDVYEKAQQGLTRVGANE